MDIIRSEISTSNLWLEYEDPQKFVTPLSGNLSAVYLTYRVVMAAYLASMWMYSYLESSAYAKWFIYLTHWSFSVLTISSIVSAVCVVRAYIKAMKTTVAMGKESMPRSTMPVSYKLMWVLQNLGFSSAIIVSCIYWGAVHDADEGLNLQNTSTHISNAMYVLLDVCLVSIPIRLLHVWHIISYCVAYTCFSYVYYLSGGTNEDGKHYVYTILDYSTRPLGAACLLFSSYIAACFIHALLFALTRLRTKLLHYYNTRSRISPMSDDGSEKILADIRYA